VSASIFPQPHADPALAAKKKRVLLVDSSRVKRDLRSETMRRLGAEVDCAADIIEARSWWRADLYDLVLLNVDEAKAQTEKFCDDIHRMMPQQQIMFLVGKPEYLATSPGDAPSAIASDDVLEAVLLDHVQSSPRANGSGHTMQDWGILEACRRISAVRSKLEARTRAMRDKPVPQRDTEVARPRRAEVAEQLESLLGVAEVPGEETK
jgi:hypothetical protein